MLVSLAKAITLTAWRLFGKALPGNVNGIWFVPRHYWSLAMSGIYYLKFIVRNISADSPTCNTHVDQLEFAVDDAWITLPVAPGGLFGKQCVFHENAHTFQVRARGTQGHAIAVVIFRELVRQEKGLIHLGFVSDAEPHHAVYNAELAFEVGRLRFPPAILSAATQTEVTQRHANSQTLPTIVRSIECQADEQRSSVVRKTAVSEAQTQTDDPSRMPLSNEQKRLLIALFALIVLKVQMKMEEMTNASNSKPVMKLCPRCSKKTKDEDSQKQNELKSKLASVAKAYRATSRPASSTPGRRRTKDEHPVDPEPHGMIRRRQTRGRMAVAQQHTVPREAIPPIHHEKVSVPTVQTNEDVLLSDGDIVERDGDLQELPSSAASSPSNKSISEGNESASSSRGESASSSSPTEASTSRTDSSSTSEESSESSNSASQSSSTSTSSRNKSKRSTSSSISEALPSNSSSKQSNANSQPLSPTSAYLKNLRQEVVNDRVMTKR